MNRFSAGNKTKVYIVGILCSVLLLTGCSVQNSTGKHPEVRVVATGLEAPWSIAFIHESALVSERDSGRILEIDEQGQIHPVFQLTDVVHGGEGGLLGLAYKEPFVFVYSTKAQGNQIQRFRLHGESGSLTLSEPTTLISNLPSGPIHNGGRLAFGPDSMLYVTVGDSGDSEQAQSLDHLGGKILRLTEDGSIPADNPLPNSPIYTYGHRNPQGIAWDESGQMYASEFGQNRWDELNQITAGANYGWPVVEGIANQDPFRDPVQQWPTDVASPSGITIHQGFLYLANLRGERLRIINLNDPASSTEFFIREFGRLRDVAFTDDGRLWMLTNNTDGRGTPQPDDDRILSVDLESLKTL